MGELKTETNIRAFLLSMCCLSDESGEVFCAFGAEEGQVGVQKTFSSASSSSLGQCNPTNTPCQRKTLRNAPIWVPMIRVQRKQSKQLVYGKNISFKITLFLKSRNNNYLMSNPGMTFTRRRARFLARFNRKPQFDLLATPLPRTGIQKSNVIYNTVSVLQTNSSCRHERWRRHKRQIRLLKRHCPKNRFSNYLTNSF